MQKKIIILKNTKLFISYNYFINNLIYLGQKKNRIANKKLTFIDFYRNRYSIISLKYIYYYYKYILRFIYQAIIKYNNMLYFITNKKYNIILFKSIIKKYTLKFYYKYDIYYTFNLTTERWITKLNNTKNRIPNIIFSIITDTYNIVKLNNICNRRGIANIALLDSNFFEQVPLSTIKNKFLYFLPGNDDSICSILGILHIIINCILVSKLKKSMLLKKKLLII